MIERAQKRFIQLFSSGSMQIIIFLIFIAISGVFAGCVTTAPTTTSEPLPTPTPDTMTTLDSDGFYHINAGGAISKNPVVMTVTQEITNMGDYDAKNVKAHVKLVFNGHTLGEETLNYGTVKVGIPVKKEFVMEAKFSKDDWSAYVANGYDGIELVMDQLTGDNVKSNLVSPSTSLSTVKSQQYKIGDVIGDGVIDCSVYDGKEHCMFNHWSYNPPTVYLEIIDTHANISGQFYTLQPLKEDLRRGAGFYIKDGPAFDMEISEAQSKYPTDQTKIVKGSN